MTNDYQELIHCEHVLNHFSVTWPLNGVEDRGDVVLISTALSLLCKSSSSSLPFSESKVTSSLAAIQRTGHRGERAVKWSIKKKQATSMNSKPEPLMCSRDTSQQIG